MKPWLYLTAAVLPFGGLILIAAWLRKRWLAREDAAIADLISPPVQTFGKLPTKEYDDVRAEAARRHAAASYRQKQSAQIASGENSHEGKRIEIVR